MSLSFYPLLPLYIYMCVCVCVCVRVCVCAYIEREEEGGRGTVIHFLGKIWTECHNNPLIIEENLIKEMHFEIILKNKYIH